MELVNQKKQGTTIDTIGGVEGFEVIGLRAQGPPKHLECTQTWPC